MKRPNRILFFYIIALLTLGLSCQTSKNASVSKMLRFNLEAGRGYDYEMNMVLDQEILGQPMKMEMGYYYSMDVSDAGNNNKLITTTIDRLKMKMGVAGMNFDVDSDNPVKSGDNASADADPFSRVNNLLAGVKGRRFMMTVDPGGHILEIKGMDVMAASMADSMQLEGTEREEFLKRFSQQMNEKSTRQQFERIWLIFPNREVKVGDHWKRTYDMSGQVPGRYTSEYTVKDIEGDMVTMEEETTIEPLGGEAENESNVKGKIEGTVVADSRSGLVVLSDLDMNMKVTSRGITVDMKGKTQIKGKAR